MSLFIGSFYAILQTLERINFPLKIDFRIKCHLETDMKKLFESKKRCARRKNYIYKDTVSSVQTIFAR